MAEYNKTVEPTSSKSLNIITISQSIIETQIIVNFVYNTTSTDKSVNTLTSSKSQSIFTIDVSQNKTQAFETPAYNSSFVGVIAYSLQLDIDNRKRFVVLDDSKNPTIFSSRTNDNPIIFNSRTNDNPIIFLSKEFENFLNKRCILENPSQNQNKEEEQDEISTTNSESIITMDNTQNKTATISTSYTSEVS